MVSDSPTQIIDVAIIGSGFAGLYSLHKFRNVLGLKAHAFDDASGVGGTWFWNRYPGAKSDTEVTGYTYSFDKDLYFEWKWSARYPRHDEIRAYLNKVADKHDLKKDISFETRVTAATWDDSIQRWKIQTDKRGEWVAQYLILGVGLLSSIYEPKFPAQDTFQGRIFHTGKWPHDVLPEDLAGKKVAVIGCGSSGVQCISALAPIVGQLTVFQRSPQYVVPAQNRKIDPAFLEHIRENWDEFWKSVLWSTTAFGFEESQVAGESVSAEERERVFQAAWEDGGGFQYMFKTFNDIGTSKISNDAAASFIRNKIAQIVKDPLLVKKLTPYELYAKRPLCCDNYYEAYNQPNVHLVDAKETPIEKFTPTGIQTKDGTIHEFDVIVTATGFDAVTGNYLKINITGRNNKKLSDHWNERPRSHLGLCISGFPNLFTIFGPMGAFTNQPPVDEAQINWIAELVLYLKSRGLSSADAKQESEEGWVSMCDDVAHKTLFPQCDSWINSSNIPGKKRAVNFYMAGSGAYMDKLEESKASGYADFEQR